MSNVTPTMGLHWTPSILFFLNIRDKNEEKAIPLINRLILLQENHATILILVAPAF
jgi:hypothetical protein